MTICRPALFDIFVFLGLYLKFFNHLLVVNFDLRFALGLFCVELADRRPVDRASHSLILLDYRRLVDLLNELWSHRGIFVVLVGPPFKCGRQRPSFLSNILSTVNTTCGRATSYIPFLVAALTLHRCLSV